MLEILRNMFSKNQPELEEIITNGAFLVDVRSPEEFADGHPEGSVNIPLGQIQNHFQELKEKKQIVVFCRSGMRSSQAKSILEKNGFNNVTNGGTWQSVKNIINKKSKS